MSFCVPAFLTRQRFSDPLIHPSAPRRGVERRLRERVMRPRIMQQAVRHKASSHKPPSPLFPTSLEHPESGMQNVVIACRFACLLCSHVTASQTHCSTQALLAQGSRGSVSARHAVTHDAAGRQTQAFLTLTSITPLPHQDRRSRVWHANCNAMACRFACLLFSHVTASPTH